MSLTVSFTVAQNILAPSTLVIADMSSGTDSDITNRKVYITTANNTYLTASGQSATSAYTDWAEPAATLNLDILNQDYCLNIRVDWCKTDGTVVYTAQNVYSFTLYSEQFYYSLTQLQAAGGANIQDTNYFNNKEKLRIFIDSANNAVQFASDIYGGQECLNAAAYMVDHQDLFF